jgi:hypothetical protein
METRLGIDVRKQIKIVIAAVVGLATLVVGVPIAASFIAPGIVYKTDPDKITSITQFHVLKDGSLYKIRFSLSDKDNSGIVTSDANVSFTAKTNNNNNTSSYILYRKDFSIKSEQFQTYAIVLTGAPIVAYTWQLNATDLQAQPGQFPMAYLNVTLPNGRMLNASTSYF